MMNKKKALQLVVLLAILLVSSCKKNKNEETPPVPPVIGLSKYIVDSTQSKLVSTPQELSEGIFRYDKLAGAENLKKGDLLIDPRNYGYLRKVESITQTNGIVTINSTQGKLSDLYRDSGRVRRAIIFPDSLKPFQRNSIAPPGSKNISAKVLANMPDFEIALGSNKGKLKFSNISFSFDPNFILDFDIKQKNFEIGFENASTEENWTVSYAGDLASGEDLNSEIDLSDKIPAKLRSIPFSSGLIFGFAEFHLKLESKVTAKAKFDINFEHKKTTHTNAYVKVENGGLASAEFNYNNPVDDNTLKLNVIGELGSIIELVPYFTIHLYQIPVVNIELKFSAEGNVNYSLLTGLWNSEVFVGGSVEGNLDGMLFDFITDSKFSKELFKIPVYEAPKALSLLTAESLTAHPGEAISSPMQFQALDSRNNPQGPVRVFFSSNYGKWENDWVDAAPFIGTVSNKFTMSDKESPHVLIAAIKNAKGDTIDKKVIYISIAPKNNLTVVPATAVWLASSVNVKAGDKLDISATGLWAHGVTTHYGPDGTNFLAGAGSWLPSANLGALIGRIDNNTPFLIGSSTSMVAQQNGILQFMMNDAIDRSDDNEGEVTVKVIVN